MIQVVAESAQIKKLSIKHNEMVNWMIENPTASRGEMAAAFGVTVPWLSTIIHSDAFKAELDRKKEKVFNSAIARPIQEKVLGAAHLALERLQQSLQLETDTRALVSAAEMLTKAAGEYKGEKNRPGGNLIHADQMFMVSADDLARAQQLIGRAKQKGVPFVNGHLADDAEVPALAAPELGESDKRAALSAEDADSDQALQARH